jgi:sarcosine oxidase/L-pipecolate oxidase
MAAAPTATSYLVVGAGCFGASTALALKKSDPGARVTLVDRTAFPCPYAAAHDLNKIIRAEYEDPMYMRLALEAMGEWRANPTLRPFFHQTGVLFASDASAPGPVIVESYEKVLGKGNSPAALLSHDEVRTRFEGVFRDGDWTGVDHWVWNPAGGWGDAESALRAVIQEAVDLGVEYVEGTVSKVEFDSAGACTGAVTEEGALLKAAKILLCTGARTAWLLAESAPDRAEVQAGGRLVAAAAIMTAFRAPKDQVSKFRHAPAVVNPLGQVPGE